MSGIPLCKSTAFCPSLFFYSSQKARLFKCSVASLFHQSSLPQFGRTQLSSRSLVDNRDYGFCSFAARRQRNRGSGSVEMDCSDDSDEQDDDVDDWDDSEVLGDEDDDGEIVLPFEKMKKWLENRPRGFGEGKMYDTSIEDNLLEEITQSQQAQAANLNKLKNSPVKGQNQKDDKIKKEPENPQNGIRVRVTNLPKKKKIERDLKSAFKGIQGLISIVPAVSGNKKTKDPIGRGFAFVDFKTNADATRFVKSFSGHMISFGKVEKQIKCQLMDTKTQEAIHEKKCSVKALEEKESFVNEFYDDYSDGIVVESDEHLCLENAIDEVIMGDHQQSPASVRVETEEEPEKVSRYVMNSQKQPEEEAPDKGERFRVHESILKAEIEQDDDQLDDKEETSVSELEELSDGEFESNSTFSGSWQETDEHVYSDIEIKDAHTEDYRHSLASISVETRDKQKKREKSRVHNSFQETECKQDYDSLDDDLDEVQTDGTRDDLDKTMNPKLRTKDDMNTSERLLRIRALEQKLLARGKLWGEAEPGEPDEKRNRPKKKNEKKKKVLVDGQAKKMAPKLQIPGSSKKLKVKEKAVLSGVLSKYAAKVALEMKES